LGAHRDRVDLSRVKLRYTLLTDAKEDVIQEEARNRGGSDLFLVLVTFEFGVNDENCNEDVAKFLAGCCVHYRVSATPVFDVGNGN
jgi:hypothetical protein